MRKAAKTGVKATPYDGGEEGPSLVQRMKSYEVEELLPGELVRQFVSYARQHCHPQLTHEAKLVIKEFYLQLRQKAASRKLSASRCAGCPSAKLPVVRYL